MRRLLSLFAALAVAGLLAAPVSAASPSAGGVVENTWDSWTGAQIGDQCTGETIDDSGSVHTVAFGDGYVHYNVEETGVGETSGTDYVGHRSVAVPLPVHPSAGGTYTATTDVSLRMVSQNGSPNQILTFHDIQVFDSSGNLLSDTFTQSFDCRG